MRFFAPVLPFFAKLGLAGLLLTIPAVAQAQGLGTGPWHESAGITDAETGVVRQRLVASHGSVTPGQTIQLAWEFTLAPEWHIYWQNAGDSGLPPELRNSAKQALPLTYPVPQVIAMPPVTNYGYKNAVTFTTSFTLPATLPPGEQSLAFTADFLYCKDVCLPGTASLTLPLARANAAIANPLFAPRQSLPQPLPEPLTAQAQGLNLQLTLLGNLATPGVHFIPQDDGVLDDSAPQTLRGTVLNLRLDNQHATPPATLDGLLLVGHDQAFRVVAPIRLAPATPPSTSGAGLLVALAGALLAGLILNLMPCVLPVLSLKLLSLAKHHHGQARLHHTLAYTGGVLASFWALAAIMALLQAGGTSLGWGFHLQEPTVVAVLTLLMVALALSFWGVFEFGTSLTRLGGVGKAERPWQSAATGLLAVVVATPCTVPFMGGALAYALTQPLPVGLLVFTALGLGMAAPFLLVAVFPSTLKFLPKPGAWMITFKHYLGWPMLATGLWLAYVYQGLTNPLATIGLLGLALLAALVLWVYGQRASWLRAGLAGAVVVAGLLALPQLNRPSPSTWQPWSPATVATAQAAGRPVFIDFTADWCLTCKVTEATVLNTNAAQALFAAENVALFRADWTRRDDTITAELAKFGRKGVPLYVLYQAGNSSPTILPQLLTVGVLRAALTAPAPTQP